MTTTSTVPSINKHESLHSIEDLTKLPANSTCMDCLETGPLYVCLNFNTLVCTSCSNIHREFNHRVKLISEFTEAEVEGLKNGGNEVARKVWLGRWIESDLRKPDQTQPDKIREFIKLKYIEKRWYKDPNEILKEREEPTKNNESKYADLHSHSQSTTSSSTSSSIHSEKIEFQTTRNPLVDTSANTIENPLPAVYNPYSTLPFPDNEQSYAKVLDYLYIGDKKTAKDKELLQSLGITYIVNATSEIRNYFEIPPFHYLKCPCVDTDVANISQYFDQAIKFIDEGRNSGHAVLVHCQQGVSRSASLVIAYLIKRNKMNLVEAYAHLRAVRPQVKPKANFIKQLAFFAKDIVHNSPQPNHQTHNNSLSPSASTSVYVSTTTASTATATANASASATTASIAPSLPTNFVSPSSKSTSSSLHSSESSTANGEKDEKSNKPMVSPKNMVSFEERKTSSIPSPPSLSPLMKSKKDEKKEESKKRKQVMGPVFQQTPSNRSPFSSSSSSSFSSSPSSSSSSSSCSSIHHARRDDAAEENSDDVIVLKRPKKSKYSIPVRTASIPPS